MLDFTLSSEDKCGQFALLILYLRWHYFTLIVFQAPKRWWYDSNHVSLLSLSSQSPFLFIRLKNIDSLPA